MLLKNASEKTNIYMVVLKRTKVSGQKSFVSNKTKVMSVKSHGKGNYH